MVLHVAVKADLHLNHILFGDLLGANPRDLLQSSVIALLVVGPGVIAFLLTRRFSAMLWVAIAVSLVACLAGTYLSSFLDSAPAPTIVVVLTAVFILALIGTRGQGARGGHQAHPG